MRNFRDYQVYKESMSFVVEIYEVTKGFPSIEKYGLTSQMRRAAVSIPSNIAEGAGRKTQKDFCRFVEIANGSAFELETQIQLAKEVGFIPGTTSTVLIEKVVSIQKQLNGLRKQLDNN